MSLRADIPDLQCHFTGKLVLQVDVIVLHIRRSNMSIDCKGVAFEVDASRRVEDRLSGRDYWAAGIHCWNDLCRADWIVRRARIIERRIRKVPEKEVLRDGVIEHPPTCAHHRLALPGNVPGCA